MRIISTSTHIKCHGWLDGKLHSTYKPSNTSTHINTVSWAKDNGWVVLVPNQGCAEIVVFNETPKSLLTIKEVQHPTSACFPNNTKRNVALGTSTGQIMIYDIKKREIKKKFPYAPSKFFQLEYSHCDKYIVAGCENGVVYIYNNVSSNTCGSFKVPKSRTLTSFRCHPVKGSYIGACSEEGIVCVWDVNRSKSVVNYEGHKLPATDIAFLSPNLEIMGSVGMDRKITLFDVRSSKIVYSGNLKRRPTVISSSADGVNIAIGFQDGEIDSFDLRKMNDSLFKFKHNEAINNIIFEKKLMDNGSVFSIHEEMVAEAKERSVKQESFDQMLFSSPLQGIPEVNVEDCNEDVNDSFFEALSFASVNQGEGAGNADSQRMSDEVRKLINLKPKIFQASGGNSADCKSSVNLNQADNFPSKTNLISTPASDSNLKSKIFQSSSGNSTECKGAVNLNQSLQASPVSATSKIKNQVHHLSNKSNLISTPVLPSDSNFPAFQVSPIITKNTDLVNSAGMKEIVRQVVREEMDEFKKEVIEELQKEVNFKILDVIKCCSKQYYDMQWFNMAQFKALGEKLDKLREDLECDNCTDSGYGRP